MAQRKRKTKTSSGERRSSAPVALSSVQKVLISGSYAAQTGEARQRRIAREGGRK